eukprot:ANDGO_05492.mRNA.1 RING finger protein 5
MSASSSNDSNSSASDGKGAFECSICLDTASEPVVTVCGHLFCWPCLFRWFESHPTNTSCPVCKASIDRSKVIPMYTRGSSSSAGSSQSDASSIPKRPQAQRPPTAQPATSSSQFYSNVSSPFGFHHQSAAVQFGGFVGFGPFVGLQWNWPQRPNRPLTPEEEAQHKLSQILMFIGVFLVFVLLFY